MLAGRRITILFVTVVLVLVGLGVSRRDQLVDERATARSRRIEAIHELHRMRRDLIAASITAGSVERETVDTRHASEELVAVTERVAGQIRTVEKDRDDAAVAAYLAGGQIGRLRECLDGINRALNQISVGDPNGPNTLSSVSGACRAVGA